MRLHHAASAGSACAHAHRRQEPMQTRTLHTPLCQPLASASSGLSRYFHVQGHGMQARFCVRPTCPGLILDSCLLRSRVSLRHGCRADTGRAASDPTSLDPAAAEPQVAWDPDGVLASAPPVPAFTGSLIERKLKERAARLAQQQQEGSDGSLSSELTSTQQVCAAGLL